MKIVDTDYTRRDKSPREVREDQTAAVMLCERKPMTVREVAAGLGDLHTERTAAILNRLTANGTLARFRAGLSEYYAAPKEALTGDGPGAGTILADSFRNVMLGCRYRLVKQRRQSTEVTAL